MSLALVRQQENENLVVHLPLNEDDRVGGFLKYYVIIAFVI